MNAPPPSIWRALLTRKMLICTGIGFSSGLPLYLLLNLVPAWLATEHLSLKAIGAFTLVQLPYNWKFLWAPLADRFGFGGLGRRRSWMLGAQLTLIGAIVALGQMHPTENLRNVVVLATLIAIASATQDIAIDAYRREILADHELGLGNAVYVNAYKISGLIPGALALILADRLPWSLVFTITALFLLPGVWLSLRVAEPARQPHTPTRLRETVIESIHEFVSRKGLAGAGTILLFMLLYKLGDSLATTLATPFYLQMGFSKTDIGTVAKLVGLWANVAGGTVGGLWMVRLGINRGLWLFGIAQAVTILGFAWLAWIGPTPVDFARQCQLGLVIGLEAFGVGLGTTAFVAFMARTTHPAYAATQYALFSGLMAVPRTGISAASGFLVESLGWPAYFLLCFALALPGMWLLRRVAPWTEKDRTSLV